MTDLPGAGRAGRIAGEVTVLQPIIILDITRTGMQIEATFALHNDSLHDFRLALRERLVVVKGRVVRCEIGELKDQAVLYRCAVEFVEPSAHATRAISDLVADYDAPPPSPRIIDGEITGEN